MKTANQLSALIGVITLLFGLPSAYGQCVHEPLFVSRLSGRVLGVTHAGEVGLRGASVAVLEARYNGRELAATVVDDDGRFAIEIKPGRYALRVTCEQFASLWCELTVERVPTSEEGSKEVVVVLGADFTTECGGSFAELRPTQLTTYPSDRPPN